MTAAEQALLGDASPSERAAIERVASSGDRDVIVIELWEMGTDPRHQVRGRQRSECVSSLDDVRRAAVEFAAKARPWDVSYMRGCVRRIVDRRPEPLTSAQRAARDAAAVRHVAPVVHEPETPEQQAERRRRSAEAMAQFRAQSGMPATRIADVIERMVS